jgi:hypothetical protein
MADRATDVDVQKVRKLLEAGRELHGKLGAVLEEIDELTGGGVGIAEKLKAIERAFDAGWCQRYAQGQSGRYVWRYATDRPNSKRLIRALGLEEVIARIPRFIANDDPFLTRSRHPFGLFVSGINQYAPEGSAIVDFEMDGGAPAVDCRHSPRCKSDHACTQKKRAELRA